MAGWLCNGMPTLTLPTGNELFPLDTESPQGASPQSAAVSLAALAAATLYFSNHTDITTVAGSRYFVEATIGNALNITGVSVLVGGTGGTDKWIAELHDSTGALVATSATAGTTAGTAGTFQQLDFTAPYAATAGTYYVVIQSNGTTAKIAAYNAPTFPLYTGSATGTFGTGAAITVPTTYTQAEGPVTLFY